ncbi:MAG: hypothetical protein PUB21_09795 [Bacteroidales bacterium]|nr:hypothetical protein [Bacteroidales bacterium]
MEEIFKQHKIDKLYLFNPENDLCIANDGEDYMAPYSARKMAGDLSALPLWYAGENSLVLRSGKMDTASYLDNIRKELNIRNIEIGDLSGKEIEQLKEIYPWGWSKAVTKRLKMMGVSPDLLPDVGNLKKLRDLSNRAFSVDLLQAVSADGIVRITEFPVIMESVEEVRLFVERYAAALLKAPWSGSGKGLCFTKGEYNIPVQRWINGTLKRQNAVIGEPLYDKALDFAMEFYSDGVGTVSFTGYSLFRTDNKGVYRENILAPDSFIEEQIGKYCDKIQLQEVQKWMSSYFSRKVAPFYKGYFGVDMLCYRKDARYYLYPCVEINLRMNMGVVARLFYDRYVMSGKRGVFRIDYEATSASLLQKHLLRKEKYPLCIAENKIQRGYLSLSDIGNDTIYQAYIVVNE